MIDIDTLIRSTTSTELFTKILDTLETVGIPAKSWRQGGVSRSVLGALAEVGYQGATIARDCVAGMFLAFGRGSYLTAHAEDVFGVIRIPSTFAAGKVTLTNTAGGVYNLGADELVARASSTGARFRVTEAFTLSSGTPAVPTSITVEVQAVEPGAASSVSPLEVDELETPLTGVTVSNAEAIVGADAETDDALVRRCLASRGTWSSLGPRDAYEFAALSATLNDGSPVSINRVTVQRTNSTGTVTVVCATPSGTPSGAELTAVEENVEAKARPDTVTAIIAGAIPKATSQTITVWCRGGVADAIEELAEDALAALISTYPIGGIPKAIGGQGYLYTDAIAAAVIGSAPEIFDVDITGGDIALAYNEVATNTTTFDVRIL